MQDHDEQINNLRERVAVNEQSIKSAHARIDQMTLGVKEEIKDLKTDMKIVVAFLERSKGMVAVITVGSAVIAWVINLFVGLFFHK